MHDYAPHISSTGLFWLFALPPGSVRADLARGTAAMRASDVAMPDARDNEGSIVGGPWVPATVSFDVEWGPPLARATLRNEAGAWGGEFVETESRIA